MAFLIDPNFKNIKMFVLVVFLAGLSHRKVKWSKKLFKKARFKGYVTRRTNWKCNFFHELCLLLATQLISVQTLSWK